MKRYFIICLFVSALNIQAGRAMSSSLMQVDTLLSVQRLEALERTEANFLASQNLLVEKENELRLAQAQLDALQKEREKLLDQVADLREMLSAQNSHKLKKQVDLLEKQLQEAQERADELSRRNQDHARTIQQLQDEMSLQNQEEAQTIRQLQEELDGLKDIRERWFQQLVADADSKWFSKPFGAIDIQELEASLPPYQKYANANRAVADTFENLQQLVKDLHIYKEGSDALQQPFNFERIEYLLEELQQIQSSTPSSRKKDVDNLVSVLGEYGASLRGVQYLIKGIEEECEGLPGSRFLVEGIVQKENDTYGTIDNLRSYPWLKQQFQGYYEAIKENGVGDNEYRQTIMNLKTR